MRKKRLKCGNWKRRNNKDGGGKRESSEKSIRYRWTQKRKDS